MCQIWFVPGQCPYLLPTTPYGTPPPSYQLNMSMICLPSPPQILAPTYTTVLSLSKDMFMNLYSWFHSQGSASGWLTLGHDGVMVTWYLSLWKHGAPWTSPSSCCKAGYSKHHSWLGSLAWNTAWTSPRDEEKESIFWKILPWPTFFS